MSEPRRKRAKPSPPTSVNANEETTPSNPETPYVNLRQLAGAIAQTTPSQRASSAGPTSAGRYGSRTPGTVDRTGAHRRTAPARRGAPTTPHAIRALQARRNAGLTPGRDRRRSGRIQRETPRDALRNLSRLLAGNTETIQPSPAGVERRSSRYPELDDYDDGPDLPIPRLSMPLGELEDDDSFHEAPPRLSVALEDLTAHSLESGRRAYSEDPRAALRRSSVGGTRLSERFDLNELGFGDESGLGGAMFRGDDDTQGILLDDGGLGDQTTHELGSMLEANSNLRRRQSDINLEDADAVEDDTFRFIIPARTRRTLELAQQRASLGEHNIIQEDDEEPVGEDEEEEEEDEEEQVEEQVEGEQQQEEEQEQQSSSSDESVEEPDQAPQLRQDPNTEAPHLERPKRPRRELKISKHGIEYPSLPSSVIKRMATNLARAHGNTNVIIRKETLDAIIQASDWFFEQAAEDLASYADHAGRKTIDESDVVSLMKRQRQINANTTAFSLAQKHLPRELLQDIRMGRRPNAKKGKKRRLERIDEEEEEA